MRAGYLDALRGMAVIWMVIFHTCYDLHMFGLVDWNFSSGFWYAFPRLIAFTFLFCVGIALNFTHRPSINFTELKKRIFKLGAAAMAISLGTYFMFPKAWIYFGTLHCILAGSVLGALVVNHRKIAGLLLITILVLQYGLDYDINWVSGIIQKNSLDFIPIYPWFWAILAGILIQPYLSKTKTLANLKSPFVLTLLGKHSLKIYLIHQPVLYGAIWGLSSIL